MWARVSPRQRNSRLSGFGDHPTGPPQKMLVTLLKKHGVNMETISFVQLAAIIIAGIIGILLNAVVSQMERRMLRWLPNVQED